MDELHPSEPEAWLWSVHGLVFVTSWRELPSLILAPQPIHVSLVVPLPRQHLWEHRSCLLDHSS